MNKSVNVTLKTSVSIQVTESEIQKIAQEIGENYSDETPETILAISAKIAASRKLAGIEGLYDVCVEECYID
jgi:hypothetical protein